LYSLILLLFVDLLARTFEAMDSVNSIVSPQPVSVGNHSQIIQLLTYFVSEGYGGTTEDSVTVIKKTNWFHKSWRTSSDSNNNNNYNIVGCNVLCLPQATLTQYLKQVTNNKVD
jgi:hypothetical protein